MAEAVLFYAFATFMLAAALSVVLTRHPIYSTLSLLVAMFCLAALFVMLGAFVVAALQVLLYAGAVLVLFLFVIMLLNLQPEEISRMRLFTLRSVGAVVAGFLLIQLLRLIAEVQAPPASAPPSGEVEALGRLLFTRYLIPFELTSFLILAAIIGAATLAKHTPPQ